MRPRTMNSMDYSDSYTVILQMMGQNDYKTPYES